MLLGLACLAALGCAKSDGNEVSVDVRTDWIPVIEFDSVLVRSGTGMPQSHPAGVGENYVSGVRVAELGNLGNGRQEIDVRLMKGTDVVAQRTVPVTLSGDLAITVILTRDCSGVSCPGAGEASASACLGGRCVDPTCTPETPESCPVDECTEDSDCPAGAQSCLEAQCIFGNCLYGDDRTCGDARYCDPDDGCTDRPVDGRDSGPADASPTDLGMDFGIDLGSGCGGVFCDAFEFCNSMLMCEPYPSCLTDSECLDGAICRNRRCIPPADDPDGDGVPAMDDCDEGNPDRFPGNEESCDDVDEDCDDIVDEGNPGILCSLVPADGECMPGGVCACPTDMFDLDGVPDNGCECMAQPGGGTGASCGAAIDLGSLSDVGESTTATGNALPAGREVWYRFQAVDSVDSAGCDSFDVEARLTTNPGDAYRLSVLRGSCGSTPDCPGEYTEYQWRANLRSTIGGILTGHCPCSPTLPPPTNVPYCTSFTGDYFVKVTRNPAVPEACDQYELTLSNAR